MEDSSSKDKHIKPPVPATCLPDDKIDNRPSRRHLMSKVTLFVDDDEDYDSALNPLLGLAYLFRSDSNLSEDLTLVSSYDEGSNFYDQTSCYLPPQREAFEDDTQTNSLATLLTMLMSCSLTQTIHLAIHNAFKNKLDYVEPYTLLILTGTISVGSFSQIWKPRNAMLIRILTLLKLAGLTLAGVILSQADVNENGWVSCMGGMYVANGQVLYACRTFLNMFWFVLTICVGDLIILLLLIGIAVSISCKKV